MQFTFNVRTPLSPEEYEEIVGTLKRMVKCPFDVQADAPPSPETLSADSEVPPAPDIPDPVADVPDIPDPAGIASLYCVYDVKGVKWDASLHSQSADGVKKKNADGTWRKRRGAGSATAAATKKSAPPRGSAIIEAETKAFQDMFTAVVLKEGVDVPSLVKSISQSVFKDLNVHVGGPEEIISKSDSKLTGKGISAIQAWAGAHGITL